MTSEGFTITDPSKMNKYGYGMHKDLAPKPKVKYLPKDLVDPDQVFDPELNEIKRSLKLDTERNSE